MANEKINNILIKDGSLIDPKSNLWGERKDILIEGGKIKVIGDDLKLSWNGVVIEAKGKYVCPGLMDMHVHLREPGYEYKEDIQSGTMAAIAGGFTSVACMPNTNPVNDNRGVNLAMEALIHQKAYCDVYQVGAISNKLEGLRLSPYFNNFYLKTDRPNIVAFSDDGNPVMSNKLMFKAMEIAKYYDVPIISHCENLFLSNRGFINEGRVSLYLGLRGIPSVSEYHMVERDIMIAERVGCKLHIAHVSTKESVDLIAKAKDRGVQVTAEVTPHHLALNEVDLMRKFTAYKMNPPLREEIDRQALVYGVINGTIDVIASDHAPHSVIDKEGSFEEAPFGCIGLETSLPVVIEILHHEEEIPIDILIEKMAITPRKILNIPYSGLKVGEIADIIIIDPDTYYCVDKEMFYSKARNCPFDGQFLRSWSTHTIHKGCLVYDQDTQMLIRG